MTYEVIHNQDDGTWDVVERPANVCVQSFWAEEDAWDWVDAQPDAGPAA